MNQNTPNLGVALKWPHPLGRPLWIGLGYCPRMTNHWPRWFWPPGLAAGKGWWWKVSPSPDGLRSTSVESAGQRHWGDPSRTDIKDRLGETRGITPDTHAPPGDASPYVLSSGGSGGFKPWWFYWARIEWTQLNFIIPF